MIVSGEIAVHGIAIMSVREGLEFETEISSDTAPLNGLVNAMLAVASDIHVLRDPTRGGITSALSEIALSAHASASPSTKQRFRSAKRSRAPAKSLGSILSTSPTKGNCWPSWPRKRSVRSSPPCGRIRLARRRRSLVRSLTIIAASFS